MKLIILDDEKVKDIFDTKFSVIATDKEIVNIGNINTEELIMSIANVIAQSYKSLQLFNKDMTKSRYLSEIIYNANIILADMGDVDLPFTEVILHDKDNNNIPGYVNVKELSIQNIEEFLLYFLADMEDEE